MIKARWIVAAVAAGLVALHVGPLLRTHLEQDKCSFGNVSNEEYRSFLARASLGTWRPLLRSDEGVTSQLNTKYHELLPNSASTVVKIAMVHAILRALGAEFRRFDDDKSRIPDSKVQRMFRYQYLLDINRLFYFAPVLRSMWMIVSVDNPLQTSSQFDVTGDLRIAAYFPNFIEGIRDVDKGSEALACPPVPQT